MSIFRPLHGFTRMFQRLFGMLMSGLVIFFPVMRGGSTVRVCGEFMEFGSSLVRVIWHSVSIPFSPLHFEPHTAAKLFNCEQPRHRQRHAPDKRANRPSEVLLHISGEPTNQDLWKPYSFA